MCAGGEVSGVAPLPPAAVHPVQGGQAGVPQVRQPRQAEVSQDPPEEPLCRHQVFHILQLQNCPNRAGENID